MNIKNSDTATPIIEIVTESVETLKRYFFVFRNFASYLQEHLILLWDSDKPEGETG